MPEIIRLRAGSRWQNSWTGQRCVVIDVSLDSVTARMLPQGTSRRFPSLEAFLGAYVAVRAAARPSSGLAPDF